MMRKFIRNKLQNFVMGVLDENSSRFMQPYQMPHQLPMTSADFMFEVLLTSHCNLNCAGCDHFCPLAEPWFADCDETERDLARMKELFGGGVKDVRLLGGEPLLHPRLTDMFRLARKYFPKSEVALITNGILLDKQDDAFWKACADNDVVIRPTIYPGVVDFEPAKAKALEFGVRWSWFAESDQGDMLFHKYRFDPDGQQNPRKSFVLCDHANNCLILKQGKIFGCTFAATAEHFNKYFGKNMETRPDDYIDIYEAQSAKEILRFAAEPVPFCRHCRTDCTVRNLEWKRSSRKIEEWT